VPVVPDCSHDARNAMPIRTTIREISCFFIGCNLLRAAKVCGCFKPNELLGILAVPSLRRSRYSHRSVPKGESVAVTNSKSLCRPLFESVCLLVCFHQVSIAS
jgi:hypothetical protein